MNNSKGPEPQMTTDEAMRFADAVMGVESRQVTDPVLCEMIRKGFDEGTDADDLIRDMVAYVKAKPRTEKRSEDGEPLGYIVG